jgi:hypothetical protein
MFYSIIKQILIVKYFSTLKWFNFEVLKKNVQEILYKFQMNNRNSMSALTEFGLKLNRNHEGKKVKDTFLQKKLKELI